MSEREPRPKSEGGPVIRFQKDKLWITFAYQHTVTKEEAEHLLDFYQVLFSQRAGRPIPREEIILGRGEGDITESKVTYISGVRGKPWPGLHVIHGEDPTILPILRDSLIKYRKTHKYLTSRQAVVVWSAIQDLEGIIQEGNDWGKINKNES